MNLNEWYFYKTIPCSLKEIHDEEVCYFHHQHIDDKRRVNVDFYRFFKKYDKRLNYENEQIDKYSIKFYTNDIGFDNDELEELIYGIHHIPCKSQLEMKYHILNFKQNECFFEKNKLKCGYQTICQDYHEDEEKVDEDFISFKNFYLKLTNPLRVLLKFEVFEIYRKLFNSENSYTFTKNLMINLDVKLGELTHAKKAKLAKELLKSKQKSLGKNLIKTNIFHELKNIPVLSKGDDFTKLINIDNQVVYLTNSLPKREELNKILIALLNSHNGVIIYGADTNTNKITGIRMDRKSRDIFRQSFNTEYKDYLVEYDGCIKYKFYEIEAEAENNLLGLSNVNNNLNQVAKNENLCVMVIKIKKIKDNKLLFDPYYKSYTIKEKYMDRYKGNIEERINLSDVRSLNMKEYIELTRKKLLKYYRKKI